MNIEQERAQIRNEYKKMMFLMAAIVIPLTIAFASAIEYLSFAFQVGIGCLVVIFVLLATLAVQNHLNNFVKEL